MSDTIASYRGDAKMVTAINAFNKIFAILLGFILTLTGGVNSVFNGDVAKFENLGGVVGLETLVRAQGVTGDGESIFYSGKSALERVSADNSEVLAINTGAIPDELKALGIKHIGGISVYNGTLYAALEDSKVWRHPVIALYDAETLKYKGIYYELSSERHTHGVPWVAVDGENGIIYAGDGRNYGSVFKYDINTLEYIGELTFSEQVEKAQGGEVHGGRLYLGTNDRTRAVYSVDTSTGEARKLFDRIAYEYKLIDNFGGEGEDLTVMTVNGELMLCTLQIGATFTDATLRGYRLADFEQ